MSSYTAFDRWVATFRHRQAIRHLRPRARVCDLGCGVETMFLAELIGASLRVGVDYQPMTRVAHGPFIVRADVTHPLPFRDGSFDCVTMLAVIEHLGSPERVLRESYRLLAPGGMVILTWPAALVDPLLAALARLGFVSPEMESDHHQPRRPAHRWMELLRGIGFTDIRHTTFELGLNHLLVATRR